MFSTPDGSFRGFENDTVELLAKETKWTSLEVITDTTFLETFILKCDFGPVKLPGLSRILNKTTDSNFECTAKCSVSIIVIMISNGNYVVKFFAASLGSLKCFDPLAASQGFIHK